MLVAIATSSIYSLKRLKKDLVNILQNCKEKSPTSAETLLLQVIKKSFEATSRKTFGPERYKINRTSPSTCFVCLYPSPQYILPCGYALCEDYVRNFESLENDRNSPTVHVHENCPIRGKSVLTPGWPWKIQLVFEAAELRILCIDGDGVRGVVTLEI